MFGNTGNILSSSLGKQLFAIQQTSRALEISQVKLSTGKRVNSPLDNPQNYFMSISLSHQASGLSRILDSVGQSIRGIQSADNALNSLQKIIDQADTVTQNAKQSLLDERKDMSTIILADNPDVYYRLNETSGVVATNLGSAGAVLDGTYQGGVSQEAGALHFGIDNASVSFDGTDDLIAIPNHILINTDPAGYPERTVELTFSADSTTGRQVLYEEGGTGNAIALYLDDGRVYYAARDGGDFGPFDISAEVKSGETYHAAFVLDSNAATFTGYLNGEAVGTGTVTKPLNTHSGAVSIGRNSGGTYFHDGAEGGNGEYFNGKVSDFALYNSVLTGADIKTRYEATQLEDTKNYQQQVMDILGQVDSLVEDSGYQGVNLLDRGSMTTYFNVSGTSKLKTQGEDFTSAGLNFKTPDFLTPDKLNETINDFDRVGDKFSAFQSSLSSDLSIIQTRENYAEKTINTLEAGSDDLTRVDQDEEAANLLALQTRQAIQLETLSLSSNNSNIANFLLLSPLES